MAVAENKARTRPSSLAKKEATLFARIRSAFTFTDPDVNSRKRIYSATEHAVKSQTPVHLVMNDHQKFLIIPSGFGVRIEPEE